MAANDIMLLRKQLTEKYERDGFDSLTEQERLELLLSYSCHSDVSSLAADLLKEYGSVNALAQADPRLLMKDIRINEQTAVLLKLIPAVSRALCMERRSVRTLSSSEAAKSFFSAHFTGTAEERLIITSVNKRFRVMSTKVLAFGTSSAATAAYRDICDFAVKSDCGIFFIAHNHPHGDALPSDSDILFTRTAAAALSGIGAVLADHIIVGSNSAFSVRVSGLVPELSAEPLRGYRTDAAANGNKTQTQKP